MVADPHPPDLQHVLELRGVGDLHLEEQDGFAFRDAVVLALLGELAVVLPGVVAGAAVGHDPDLAPPGWPLLRSPEASRRALCAPAWAPATAAPPRRVSWRLSR